MNEVKKTSAPGAETGKAAYVKPTMQVYELEMENSILVGSGSDSKRGGSWGANANPVTSNPWDSMGDNELNA